MRKAAWRIALIATLILTGCSGVGGQGSVKVAAEPATDGPLSLTNRPDDPPDYSELLRDPTEALRGPTLTPTVTSTPGPTGTPFQPATITPSPVPSPTPTQVPLPILTLDKFFTQGVAPVTYLKDQCQYLRERWNPENSPPGTIVVPVMYHSIVQPGHGIPAGDTTTITSAYFIQSIEHAHTLGFQTITTDQLAGFLEHNAKIPPLSMILIVDDRRQGTVQQHFMPYLEKYNWTATLAYISGMVEDREWKEVQALLATGHLDVQAHGFMHNGSTYFKSYTPLSIIDQEIYFPIPVLQERIGYRPIAFIWPGGDFVPAAMPVVHDAGYQMGFTAYPRGPIMFNWVPQGEPERALNDPLMLLPRYWSKTLYVNLDQAVKASDSAKAFATANKDLELAWMDKNCK